MDRRFIIFIVFSIIVLYGWQYLGHKDNTNPAPAVKTQEQTVNNEIKQEKTKNSINITNNDNLLIQNNKNKEEKINKISNGNVTIEATNKGARLTHVIIDYVHQKEDEIDDLVDQLDRNDYLALKTTLNNRNINFNDMIWDVKEEDKSLIYSLKLKNNVKIIKKIELNDNNTGSIILEIANNSDQEISFKNIALQWGPGKSPEGNRFNVKSIVALMGRKVDRFKPKKKEQVTNLDVKNGFFGMQSQYFCSLFYQNNEFIKNITVKQNANQTLDLIMHYNNVNLKPGKNEIMPISFYFGPENYDKLSKLNIGAQKVVDFGIFRFLSVPMYHVLKFLYKITGNYGIAIILLTILIRGILWWPTHRSQTSMKKMQTAMSKMQPRLKTLKEIYKDNPQKLNEETMKLYKEYQINPMGGCLPMLLMMPVLFAMFSIMRSAVELKGAAFFWIWQDLSAKDPLYILPIAMGLSMFIQQKISTPPAATTEAATQQKLMLYLMPAMLTFFSFMWPSGLLLYWVVSNILSIGQQVLINRKA